MSDPRIVATFKSHDAAQSYRLVHTGTHYEMQKDPYQDSQWEEIEGDSFSLLAILIDPTESADIKIEYTINEIYE